jgi:hypothetical protein
MLGSLTEADDAVQDAWLRLSQSDAEQIDNLGGWLTTVVARECLHLLRSRRRRHEDLFGGHLPDPVVVPDGDLDPEQEALLADSAAASEPGAATRQRRRRPAAAHGPGAAVITLHGQPYSVLAFTVVGGKITEIDGIGDPDRVRRIAAGVLNDR